MKMVVAFYENKMGECTKQLFLILFTSQDIGQCVYNIIYMLSWSELELYLYHRAASSKTYCMVLGYNCTKLGALFSRFH